MRSVEEQQARISAAAVAPRPIRVAIAEAQGLMCAEEVVTERPLPGFDQAAIDGYAVRSVDVVGVGFGEGGVGLVGPFSDEDTDEDQRGGLVLPVTGTIEAGSRTPSRLQPRQAARVQTGAPLPTLADAVLPLRWTDGGTQRVRILRGAPSGAYVRRAGDDVQPGDVAVRAGTIIGAAQVGLLAAVGRERVLVHPRPRVSVMAVGGELVDITRNPGNGQVYDVNSYALAAAGRDAGAEVNRIGIVSNDPKELGEIVEGQINRAEVLVIAGGVGGAAAEAVRAVLSELGEMEVVRVAMHPGSVQGFGQLGREGVPDVPAAGQSRQRPGGLRGDGPATDPAVAGQAPADAPDRAGPDAVTDHIGGRAQGLSSRSADARSGKR